ncbi:GNAT family N-acetyltransferase [Paenibacillus albus]|uniref:N-acetyltransferase n=1 Tax=Paenibacillus albus TaxID=2495582 RepID=A0A3S9A7H3_9BACL|nr:GNAT family N-acetyltransferase [Paenibacillus albus]AZN41702.1 N-acetyltransferase [Paenibacillus albus]
MDFKKLDLEGLSILEEWFKDPEVLKWLSGTLPLNRWYEYVEQSPSYFAWMVYEEGSRIGQISLEIYSDNTASIEILTNPPLRNKGYGKRMLEAFLTRPELATVQTIKVGIEHDNITSLNCFKKIGFVEQEFDLEGLVTLTFSLHKVEENL